MVVWSVVWCFVLSWDEADQSSVHDSSVSRESDVATRFVAPALLRKVIR